ncbi:MAG: aminotransferase class IV [Acidobacteriota bacterium]
MNENVYFEGLICPAGEASIPAVSAAALYGKGIFTTVAVRHGAPWLWEKHWQRLEGDALKLDLDLRGHTAMSFYGALQQIVKANALSNGRARATFFDRRGGGQWPFKIVPHSSLLITTADNHPPTADFILGLSAYRVNHRSPLTGVKSCCYLENLWAKQDAKTNDWAEAVRLNTDGEVASGCMSNIFWLRNGELHTPPLISGCLPGTTRAFVMENIECIESAARLEKLDEAEAIYLTSAGIGVTRVTSYRGRKLGGADHPIMKLIPRV